MKKTTIAIAALLGFFAYSYAQNAAAPQTKQETAKTENTVFCPVSGEKVVVNEATPKAEYNGKTYYFCCNNCLEKFNKEPAKYAQNAQVKGKTCACSCECCKNGKCDCKKEKCDCKDCKCHEKGECNCKDCSNMKGDKSEGMKKQKGKTCKNCGQEKAEQKTEKNTK